MINFHEVYNNLSNQMVGNQKKIVADTCLDVFFGYSFDGNLRLSFKSKSSPAKIESTKILHVVQGRENNETYWTSFDLLNAEVRDAFFSFCENMVDSVIGIYDESVALSLLRRRFITWKTLFQKASTQSISKESQIGLLGELIVLKEVLSPKYGINTAVKSWGGPRMQSKDFTICDTWYEVKTVGSTIDNVQIASLAQLDSQSIGHLVIVRVETVSSEYCGNCFGIVDLIKEILLTISDEKIEELFISKINNIGIDILKIEDTDRFDVKSITKYLVTDDFPRITKESVPFPEITSVQYEISIASISRFKEE